MGTEGELDRRTTVSIMASDLDRLQSLQRRVSADRGAWVTMPEILKGLIDHAETPQNGA